MLKWRIATMWFALQQVATQMKISPHWKLHFPPVRARAPRRSFSRRHPRGKSAPAEAFLSPTELLPPENAAGRTCAAVVTSFPPCVPILAPGEEITQAHIGYLHEVQRLGGSVTGLEDGKCLVVR